MKLLTIALMTNILGIATWIDCHQKYHHVTRHQKSLLMPLVMLLYAMITPKILLLQMLGMGLGWVGDIFLLKDDKPYFITGGISFMIGHMCYGLLYLTEINLLSLPWWIYAMLIVYIMLIILVYRYLKPYIQEGYGKLVVIYMIFISLMSYFALCRFPFVNFTSWLLVWIGSLIFMASDTLVSFEKFVNHDIHGVMETYVPAQYLLMLGMALV